MAAMPVYPAPPPFWEFLRVLGVFGISLSNLFLIASVYGSLNYSLLPAPKRLFCFLYYPVQLLSGACHEAVLCFVIPCGCNCTCPIFVSEMLLNLYVTFLDGRKVVQLGKSQDQVCVSKIKRIWWQ